MSTIAAPKKTYELVAFLCLLPALFIQMKWMKITANNSIAIDDRKRAFVELFPSFLASAKLLMVISLVFALLAIILAGKSFNQKKVLWRISSFVIVLIAAAIVLFNIFQLM
jgi:hypothetical protein